MKESFFFILFEELESKSGIEFFVVFLYFLDDILYYDVLFYVVLIIL